MAGAHWLVVLSQGPPEEGGLKMAWSTINFVKHEGKTLPQVLFSDPDWFFWAMKNDVFKNKGALETEAAVICHRATRIRIPNNNNGHLKVEYVIHRPTGKFSHFDVVPATQPQHDGSSPTFCASHIDMSVPTGLAPYDKTGCANLIKSLKAVVFPGKSRLTKSAYEKFFDDPTNFIP